MEDHRRSMTMMEEMMMMMLKTNKCRMVAHCGG